MAFVQVTMLLPHFHTSNGTPLAGGTLELYEAGTTTPAEFFTADGATLGTTESLDARGEPSADLYLDSVGVYKFRLLDASNVLIREWDNVAPPVTANGTLEWLSPKSATFVDTDTFTFDGNPENDAGETVYHARRRVRIYRHTSDDYLYADIESSTYNSGTDTTTVNLATPIIDADGDEVTLTNEDLTTWAGIASDGPSASIPATRVNIRRFGAVPGAGIDNTAALQAAHDSLPDSGGEIFVPRAFGGTAFADSSRYFCDSGVTFTKPIMITGEGHDSSALVYTGASIFITQGTRELILKNVAILGVDGAGGEIYNPGSTGISMQGLLKAPGARIAQFEFGIQYEGGFYHKFIDTEFDRNKIHLNEFNANNLTFTGCRFTKSEQILVCNAGSGPVTFTGCSLEQFHTNAIATESGAAFDVTLVGNYIENYPSVTTESGIGGATDTYDSGIVIQNGGEGHVTLLGNMINTKGITRIINHSGSSISNITSLGNTLVLHNTAPDDTLTHFAVLGTDAKVLAFDFGEGTPPAAAVYLSGLGAGDEALYRDPIAGNTIVFHEEDWTEPALENGWTNDGSANFPDFGYYKDAQNRVHLKGIVDGGSSTDTTVFTLPAGYRPEEYHYVAATLTGGTHVVVRVAPSGPVQVVDPLTPINVSLNGISFRVA